MVNIENKNIKRREWYKRRTLDQIATQKAKDKRRYNKLRLEASDKGLSVYKYYHKHSVESSWKTFISHKFKSAKKHARKDGLEFNITNEFVQELLIRQDYKCAAMGKALVHIMDTPGSMSIDRIDSSIGYTADNIQLVSHFYNLGKNRFKNADVIAFLTQK